MFKYTREVKKVSQRKIKYYFEDSDCLFSNVWKQVCRPIDCTVACGFALTLKDR